MPAPGTIRALRAPTGPGVRYDGGVYGGFTVPVHYDPLLAKLITWGGDRNEAAARMTRALDELRVDGVKTSTAFHRRVMTHPAFLAGDLHTGFLAEHPELMRPEHDPWLEELATLAAAVARFRRLSDCPCKGRRPTLGPAFRLEAQRGRRVAALSSGYGRFDCVEIVVAVDGSYVVTLDGVEHAVDAREAGADLLDPLRREVVRGLRRSAGPKYTVRSARKSDRELADASRGGREQLRKRGPRLPIPSCRESRARPGRAWDHVRGTGLGRRQAMKMGERVGAPRAGRVQSVDVTPGQTVETGARLVVLD
jgi:acetyl/propionyl-CoA carboxylase alpha subunit